MAEENLEAGRVAVHDSGALWIVHPSAATERAAIQLSGQLAKMLERLAPPETVFHDLRHVTLLGPDYVDQFKQIAEQRLGKVRNTICLIPNSIHKGFAKSAPVGQRWLIFPAEKQAVAAVQRFAKK